METIRRTKLIDASKAAVWSALGDFQWIGNYHPYITSVDLNTEHNGGLGSQRTCHFNDGTQINEEIVGTLLHSLAENEPENAPAPIEGDRA